MAPRPRVTPEPPDGTRACASGADTWISAKIEGQELPPFRTQLLEILSLLPSAEAQAELLETIKEWMKLAQEGKIDQDEDWDWMRAAPDVFEIKLPNWHFAGGVMHLRLYYAEPRDLPGHLVALGIQAKRPGPIDLPDQTAAAVQASALLEKFARNGFE